MKEGLRVSCFPPEEIQQRCQIWTNHCTFLLNLSITTFTDKLFPRGIFLDITINFVSFHRTYFPQFPLPFITWSDIWRLKTINWFKILHGELFPPFLLPLSQTNGLKISLNFFLKKSLNWFKIDLKFILDRELFPPFLLPLSQTNASRFP